MNMMFGRAIPSGSPWTDERVAILRQMWSDGFSAGVIADNLGRGITRNSVIGKAHRLGLVGRGSPIRAASKPRRPAQPRKPRSAPVMARAPVSPAPAPPVAFVAPIARKLTTEKLTEHTCKWPIGDPRNADFGFCGAEPEDGRPYCPYHCIIAYVPCRRRVA